MTLYSLFITILFVLAVYLIKKLWDERCDYKKWFEASKEYDVKEYCVRKLANETRRVPKPLVKKEVLNNPYRLEGKFPPYPKLNKDGSIAKKRGRKSKNGTAVNS